MGFNHWVESLESRRLMDAGNLDTSFADDGVLEFGRGEAVEVRSFDLAVAPQDGFVVAAVLRPAAAAAATTIEVQRIYGDGTTSLTFAGDGVLEIPVPADLGGSSFAGGPFADVKVTPDGGILLSMGYRIWKLRANGTLDRTFGHRGRAAFDEFHEGRMQLDVDGRGRIYVAGPTGGPANDASTIRLHVLNPDGSLVRTVGGDTGTPIGNALRRSNQFGLRVFDHGGDGGKILLTATRSLFAGEAYTAVRLDAADGSLDATYGGGDGIAAGSFEGAVDDGIIDEATLFTADNGEVYIHHEQGSDDPGNPFAESAVHKFDAAGTFVANAITDPDALEFPQRIVRDDALFLVNTFAGGVQFLDAGGAAIPDAIANAAEALDDPDVDGGAEFHLARDGTIYVVQQRNGDGATGVGNGYRIARLFRDDSPAAQVSVKNLAQDRAAAHRFAVQYRDVDGVDPATLGDDDITIIAPDGTRLRARLSGADAPVGPQPVVNARYRVTPPDGVWDAADSGTYTVRLNRRSVRDADGNAAAQRAVGVFHVTIAPELAGSAAPQSRAALPMATRASFDELLAPATPSLLEDL